MMAHSVNLSITFTFNYLQVAEDCLTTIKYVETEILAGDFAGEKNIGKLIEYLAEDLTRSGSQVLVELKRDFLTTEIGASVSQYDRRVIV